MRFRTAPLSTGLLGTSWQPSWWTFTSSEFNTAPLSTGLLGNLVGVAPSTAVFMAVYEPMKQAVSERVPADRSFLGPMIAGAASGLAASLIRVPTEVVKQRMQSGALPHDLNISELVVCVIWPCRLAAPLACVPTEVVKQRMQLGTSLPCPGTPHRVSSKMGGCLLLAGCNVVPGNRDRPAAHCQLQFARMACVRERAQPAL